MADNQPLPAAPSPEQKAARLSPQQQLAAQQPDLQQQPPADLQQQPPADLQQQPPADLQQQPPAAPQQQPPAAPQQQPPAAPQQQPPAAPQQQPPAAPQQQPPAADLQQVSPDEELLFALTVSTKKLQADIDRIDTALKALQSRPPSASPLKVKAKTEGGQRVFEIAGKNFRFDHSKQRFV